MRSIPEALKSEIIRKYLEGLSIRQISKLLGVSVGAVSTLTTEASRKDEFILYMREMAIKFRTKNLEFADVMSGIRLYNKIKKLGLTCSFFEHFLESTNLESFKLEIEHDKFLTKIITILQFERQYQINLVNIPAYIRDKKQEIHKINNEIYRRNQSLYSQYSVKEEEIQEYLKEKPKLLTASRLAKVALPTHADWLIISDHLFEKALKKSGIKIDPTILYKKLNYIYKNPDKHINIIKQILELPND